ncbi:unnamed protein product [Brassica rapa subsp. narinosa]
MVDIRRWRRSRVVRFDARLVKPKPKVEQTTKIRWNQIGIAPLTSVCTESIYVAVLVHTYLYI